MLNRKIKRIYADLKLPEKLKDAFQKLRRTFHNGRGIAPLTAALLILLCYPLGALISEDIDTTTEYEFAKKDNRSSTVDAMSFLITREVYNKSWTPALPFIFPAYMLDNMPSFQLGLMSSVSTMSKAFAARFDKTTADEDKLPLKNAAELLQYPGTIWMFSPTNKLVPAPSSNSQYRRARKQLQNYNNMLADGRALFPATAQNLESILQMISTDLQKNSRRLESHIRENSSNWYDGKADNLFYYSRGKLYAYNLLLKALSDDFKDVILQHNVYQGWTSMLKALENAAHLSPAVVRNGRLDSLTAPNHLAAIGLYNNKAVVALQNILAQIKETPLDGVQP